MAMATSSRRRSGRQRAEPDVEAEMSSGEEIVIPNYERQTYPLDDEANVEIQEILQSEEFANFDLHLRRLAEALTSTAGEVNDALADAKGRYERQKRKREEEKANEDGDGDDDRTAADDEPDGNHIEDLEMRVDVTTKKLEEEMRRLVDSEGGAVEEVLPATEHIGNQLKERQAQWENLSLTQRYTTNNAYIGFYRIVHDSKHLGDDITPLPHPSTWLSHIETPETAGSSSRPARQERGSAAGNPDDDVAIERERLSIRCPITLLPFKDPVTSTKCPHSFERTAIEDMISRSTETMLVPLPNTNNGRRRVRCIKCPVCSAQLALQYLRHDPVLLRRVRRALETAAMDEEEANNAEAVDEEEDDQDMAIDTKESKPVKVKLEKVDSPPRWLSGVPSARVVTIDDDGDEEMADAEALEEEEEEEEEEDDE
ncbi:predicted protein [Uncinocarpus reesii 1704]|uniref:SP-RING-type domain-containing protein n=1 Tax=Uncinocarpus reesii (strain UAMH 1704) TaxID=336963 RepID=C4JGL3_UNCRE|nr:uncharacterized protein UREG_01204 [Uncinocarpus reesii 1704]EEP76355.1 predicted protein [Uncinocarpus reesii 1704]